MRKVTCSVCDGDGFLRLNSGETVFAENCKCCGGAQTVDMHRVDDGYLYQFRKEPGVDTVLAERNCVGWVVDATGAPMPGTEGDVANGCHLLARDLDAAAILRSKTRKTEKRPDESEELERLANLVHHAEKLEDKARDAYSAALRDYSVSLTDLAYLEARARAAEREAHSALSAYFVSATSKTKGVT